MKKMRSRSSTLSVISAVSALAASGLAHAADPPLVLEPSSAWTVSYAKEACHLARTFGEGENTVAVDFRQYAPDRPFNLIALGVPLAQSGSPKPLTTEFRPGGGRNDDWPPRMVKQADGRGLIETTALLLPTPQSSAPKAIKKQEWRAGGEEALPRPVDRAKEAKISELWIAGAMSRTIVLELGRMDLPLDQMRSCLDNLLVKWGIDPEVYHGLTRRAAPSTFPGDWVTPGDYPVSMLQAGLGGIVRFRLMVDKGGKPTKCIVQSTAGEDFDQTTCEVMMKRARFLPAIDAHGQPVASFYESSVRFSTP